ncbi:MAG: TIGR02530 family flagellar biosynthesis protein [candidate division Zixibacteria bacterium]
MKNVTLNGAINPAGIKPRSEPIAPTGKTDFKNQLIDSIGQRESVKFSNHAAERLRSRDVEMTPDKAERLVKAVDAANEKGAKESLVLLDELAFVVSVKNRTVITACELNGLKDGVFTKIDSAIVG